MPYKDSQSKEAKESQKRRNKKYYDKAKNNKIEKIIPKTKECSVCKKTKSWESFYPRKNRKCGLTSWCKKCLDNHRSKYKEKAKEVRRFRDFGITSEEYNTLYSNQDGRCAICLKKEKDCQQKTLCVDHDHKTGEVRGLLCHGCNTGIGRMEDNIETLKNAIKYLIN